MQETPEITWWFAELLLFLRYQDVAVKRRDNFKLGLLDKVAEFYFSATFLLIISTKASCSFLLSEA